MEKQSVKLFLVEADMHPRTDGVDDGATWTMLLERLETRLWSRFMSGGLSEARLWLLDALSSITSIRPHHQKEMFMKLLRSKPTNSELASQALRMMFDRKPARVGSILARKSGILEKFFDGHPRRILQWFSHFSSDEGSAHKRGAKALSQFAFLNRDLCWDELDWKGKHGQSPVVVAAKPYYLLDLDIQRTIENFIDNVPEFWVSSEFSESLKDGEIISIDENFFVDFFLGLMYTDNSEDVWAALSDFLVEESFCLLSRHLLIALNEQELSKFLGILGKYIKPREETFAVSHCSYWLELLIHKSIVKLNDILMLNAVINQGTKLLRIVQEEDLDEKEKIMETLSELITLSNNSSSMFPLLKVCLKGSFERAMKLLGLLSWVIYFILSQTCQSLDSWEKILTANNIRFKISDVYGLLEEKELSEDELTKKRKHRKYKKSKKKRKEEMSHFDSYNDNLLEEDVSVSNGLNRNWLLSTDDFSRSWATADLPEHLSKVCFSGWMKWVLNRWNDIN